MCSSTQSLTAALEGCEWSASHHGRFTPRERDASTYWIRGWVGSRTGLDMVSKKKFSAPAWNRIPIIRLPSPQSIFYTDWAIQAHNVITHFTYRQTSCTSVLPLLEPVPSLCHPGGGGLRKCYTTLAPPEGTDWGWWWWPSITTQWGCTKVTPCEETGNCKHEAAFFMSLPGSIISRCLSWVWHLTLSASIYHMFLLLLLRIPVIYFRILFTFLSSFFPLDC
jgi:hypothetical protein